MLICVLHRDSSKHTHTQKKKKKKKREKRDSRNSGLVPTKLLNFSLSKLSRLNFSQLNILTVCFILVIAFLFLRNTDSRKGTMCAFFVPIHKKKKIKVRTLKLYLRKHSMGLSILSGQKKLCILMEVS